MSVISSARPWEARSQGTGRVEKSRQSSSSAVPSRESTDAAWSSPPVEAPAKSVSAVIAARTRCSGVVPRPSSASIASAAAHSSAAELDNPAPSGTCPSIRMSRPWDASPVRCASSAHSTPAT